MRIQLFTKPILVGLVLIAGLGLLLTSAGNTQAQGETPHAAGADWYTYANGDDILVLETEGAIVWAGTRGGGLVRWDTTDGTSVQFLKPQDPLAGNTVRDVYVDADGNKWLATDDGLSFLDDNGTPDKADDVWYTYAYWPVGAYLPSNRITALAVDEAGFLWIGTSQYWDSRTEAYTGGGLVKVDTKGTLNPIDDEWIQTYTLADTRSTEGSDIVLGLASDNITSILPASGNRIWIGTQQHWDYRQFGEDFESRWMQVHGGLSRLEHAGTPETEDDVWRTWTCEGEIQRDPALSCIIHDLELGPNGYVWAVQRGKGAIAFPQDAGEDLNPVHFEKPSKPDQEGLAANSVAAIAFGSPDVPEWGNTVWFATYDAATGQGRGISVLDHQDTIREQADDRWNESNPTPFETITTDDGLPNNYIQAMAGGQGKIWLGIGGMYGKAYGLTAFDLNQNIVQEPLNTAGQTGTPYNYISDLAVGQEGTHWENQIWIATGNKRPRSYGAGVLRLDTQGTTDPQDDVWTQFTKENTDDDGEPPWTGLASNNVTAVVIDGDNVWFGTQPATWDADNRRWTDGGLSVYDGEQWTVRTAENTGGTTSGMRWDTISALGVGCEGELWVGLSKPGDDAGSGAGIAILDTQDDPHNLDDDAWQEPIRYPEIPSNAVTDFAPDCERDQMWISTIPYFDGRNALGGGVARYDNATSTWDIWTAADGVESYAEDNITGMIGTVEVGPDGTVWAGGWGYQATSRQEMSRAWPFVPAAVNWFRDGQWSSQVFEDDGWISDIAVDGNSRVWAGTSRGGMDRSPADGKEDDPRLDPASGGVKHTIDGTQWAAWNTENSPLATNDVSVIEVGPNGDVWVGTSGWGLMRFGAPLPVIPGAGAFRTEVGMPSRLETGESATLEVTLRNESADAVLDNPRFRLRIQQDRTAPVLDLTQPEVVSQSATAAPGSSITATFSVRAASPGNATLSVDVIGDVGSISESARYVTRLSAQPAEVRVTGTFYLPLIVSE